MATKLHVVDLFAGTGAFSLACESTKKCKVVYSNDYCKNSKKIYDHNFKHKLSFSDLNKVKLSNIPSHNLLTAGFPCQPFSIAGIQKGFNDERSNVFWKILKIIKKNKPRFFFLENVKNLKSHDKGKTFTTINEKLEKENYYLKHQILNTCDFTQVPQNRERIYIIGFKNKADHDKFNFDFKKIKNLKISHYLQKNVPDSFYYTDKVKVYPKLVEGVTKSIDDNVVYQYRRYYVRENKNGKVPTLTANMGTGGHNVPIIKDKKGIRKLTPKECFNLQGFPSSYKLPKDMSNGALYKLAGNAVSYPLIKKIVNKLIEISDEK